MCVSFCSSHVVFVGCLGRLLRIACVVSSSWSYRVLFWPLRPISRPDRIAGLISCVLAAWRKSTYITRVASSFVPFLDTLQHLFSLESKTMPNIARAGPLLFGRSGQETRALGGLFVAVTICPDRLHAPSCSYTSCEAASLLCPERRSCSR